MFKVGDKVIWYRGTKEQIPGIVVNVTDKKVHIKTRFGINKVYPDNVEMIYDRR